MEVFEGVVVHEAVFRSTCNETPLRDKSIINKFGLSVLNNPSLPVVEKSKTMLHGQFHPFFWRKQQAPDLRATFFCDSFYIFQLVGKVLISVGTFETEP